MIGRVSAETPRGDPATSREEPMRNPCLTCGACCAYFRNSFYWAEAGDATPGGIDPALTEKLTPFMRVMKGTNQSKPRCIALGGTIGVEVGCTAYETRPSPCRDFVPSWMDGTHNERCDAARAAHGMAPIPPEWYLEAEEDAPAQVVAVAPLVAAAGGKPDDDPDNDPDQPPTPPDFAPEPPVPTAA